MAARKILVTGGAGYIGGTVISQLLSPKTGSPVQPSEIIAIVRKPDVATKMEKLGIEVSSVSLTDESAIESLVLDKGVNLVIHCASATDASVAKPLIKALSAQKKKSGDDVYFIHTSGTSCFSDRTGWNHGLVRDTDNVYELEKPIEHLYFVRETNVAVYELAKELGVTLSTVVPPQIYGEGMGEGSRQSTVIPMYIQSALNLKAMHRDRVRGDWPAVHVHDLAEFYILLIQKILSGNASTADVAGYFFPVTHYIDLWDTADALAEALYTRGLIKEPKAVEWPSDEVASEAFSFPVELIPMLYRSVQKIEPVRPQQLGWKPKWDKERYPEALVSDVETFLRLSDSSNPTSFQNAIKSAQKMKMTTS